MFQFRLNSTSERKAIFFASAHKSIKPPPFNAIIVRDLLQDLPLLRCTRMCGYIIKMMAAALRYDK
ncbi:hypothetical protein EFB08_04260 [Rufibacter latericius]|uniref:Uncharacterized protein n=1 Tax=Rufibacter latericius TaxID=2487040 RepID=A0A3M9MY70_9BACT|nr:hypothetical protein EFB08_04260 [Rufibacter latericius]